MLVLARKEGESIIIADCIRITIAGVEGGRVKLGIVAPNEIAVHREEIWNHVQKENSASQLSPTRFVQLASQFLKQREEPIRPLLRRVV